MPAPLESFARVTSRRRLVVVLLGVLTITFLAPVTARAVTAPGVPTGVTAIAGPLSAAVSWTAPVGIENSPVTSYTATAEPGGSTCTTQGATSCTATGLNSGVEYTFTVVASNDAGASAPSGSSDPVVPGPATVPAAPADVLASAGRLSATIVWMAPADGGSPITAYTVTADPGSASCSTTGATSCVLAPLEPGIPVSFRVVASNAVGPGAPSEPSGAVVPTPAVAPDAPTGVTAVAGIGSATVSWSPPSDDGGQPVQSYTATANPGSASCSTLTLLTCDVTGLAAGQTYTFTVTASSAIGVSTASAPSAAVTPIAATIPARVPGAPTILSATLVGDERNAQITWTAPADNGGAAVTDYVLQANGRTVRAPRFDGSTSATVSGLRYGRRYQFTVLARNAAGLGLASTASTPVTPLITTDLRITSISSVYRPGGRAARVVGQWLRADTRGGVDAGAVSLVVRSRGSRSTFRTWATVRPDASGTISFAALRPTRAVEVRLVAPTVGAYRGRTSAVRAIDLTPVIRLSLSTATLTVGHAARVAVHVTPRLARQRVYLQQQRGRRWVRLLTGSLTSRSAYSFAVRERLAGRYLLRAVVPASSLAGAAASRQVTLRVRVAQSHTRARLTARIIKKGRSARIYGSVTPTLARHRVLLQTTSHSRWHTIDQQNLDGRSRFDFSVRPTAGTHTYRVYEPGVRRRVDGSASHALRLTVRAPVRRKPAPPPPPSGSCTPGYRPCIPPGPDVDCAGGSGNGPRYVDGPVYVTGSDPYGLDADGDGVACET